MIMPMIHARMTGEDLTVWRKKQPGTYPAKNGATMQGWSQKTAAKWFGCSYRQWQRYESGESGVPLTLVRRIQAYSTDLTEMLDRIFDTTDDKIERWGGPHEMPEHEEVGP